MTYSTKYRDLKPYAIEKTRAMIGDKGNTIWKQSKTRQAEIMEDWLSEMSKTYQIDKPTLKLYAEDCGSGMYVPELNLILLPKCSVVTLLHEFKHALQMQKDRKNTEKIARGWSISLFYRAKPKLYRTAVRKHVLLYA